MASKRQIWANRRNAELSTGPRTITGKLRSRPNAFKHGLTARTVIDPCESRTEFRTFHKKVAAAYCPRSLLDHELINRLAGLLWRLRRAHAIETGLLAIQASIQADLHQQLDTCLELDASDPVQLARAFLRVSNFNGAILDRLNRYEISLWRQTAQLLFLLEAIAQPRNALGSLSGTRLSRTHAGGV